MYALAKRSESCLDCHFCDYFIQCPKNNNSCLGCGTCIKGCPAGARSLVSNQKPRPMTKIMIDGEHCTVPYGITIGQALEITGKRPPTPHNCCTGGCYNCAVVVDGSLIRSCCTGIHENMKIATDRKEIDSHPPLRLVSFFPGHLHASISVFTHGCNFNCDFCHNWNITFASTGRPVTPQGAALTAGQAISSSQDQRIGISGGEPTLNRRWLVDFIHELKTQFRHLRIQVDTNASLLTKDYIDELYNAGMTDISLDIKGMELDTFIKCTGVTNRELAQEYLTASWQSIEYIIDRYTGKLFYTVGLPFHPDFVTGEELFRMGNRLASLEKDMDVNLIVYQPAFRMRNTDPVPDTDIDNALELLNSTGIKRVWCQEGEDIPLPTDPEDLLLMGGE
ncbi:MAG: radical SAM protein [Bacillota bacterium]